MARVAAEWRSASLSPRELALCAFAETLTQTPIRVEAEDIEPLRRAGFDDDAVTDVVQTVAYFNYINRVAEGLGVDPESWLERMDTR